LGKKSVSRSFWAQLPQFKGFRPFPTLKLFNKGPKKTLKKGSSRAIDRALPCFILNKNKKLSTISSIVTKANKALIKVEIKKTGLEIIVAISSFAVFFPFPLNLPLKCHRQIQLNG
jgi:hypothetical protein